MLVKRSFNINEYGEQRPLTLFVWKRVLFFRLSVLQLFLIEVFNILQSFLLTDSCTMSDEYRIKQRGLYERYLYQLSSLSSIGEVFELA